MKPDLLELLKEKKVKITAERQEIIAVLEKAKFPLTPADIYLRIIAKLPKANLTTVYRNLEMLEGFGLVKRLTFGKSSFSYELTSDRAHHHHAVCLRCGQVEELEGVSEKFVNEVTESTRFRIEDHNLEFFGVCEKCQKL